LPSRKFEELGFQEALDF
jgi:hypothetical protein